MEKILNWLTILHEQEIETFDNLVNLSEREWDLLVLPLAVRSSIKSFIEIWHEEQIAGVRESMQLTSNSISQIDCVVMDISSSMKARSHLDSDKSREDVSKILFHTMMDKLISLELSHVVGLISFGAEIHSVCITGRYEQFHDELGRLDARENSTRLYDAICVAIKTVQSYANANVPDPSTVIKRVFVLTDGEDNASESLPWHVAKLLQDSSIFLDAIPVAGPNITLQALCHSSGGLCFETVSEAQAMALFENEATLHLSYRKGQHDGEGISTNPTVTINGPMDFAAVLERLKVSKDGAVREVSPSVPKSVSSRVLSPEATQSAVASGLLQTKYGGSGVGPGGATAKRILKELSRYHHDESLKCQLNSFCQIHVSAEDASIWKVLLYNLPDPYKDGTWLLMVEFGVKYPLSPPSVRFATPIFHCNVSTGGQLCMDILKDKWNPGITIFDVLLSIHQLILNPNANDPLDAFKGQTLRDNPSEYVVMARAHTAKHASTSIEEMSSRFLLS